MSWREALLIFGICAVVGLIISGIVFYNVLEGFLF